MSIIYVIFLAMVVVALLAATVIVFFTVSRRKIIQEQLERKNLELNYKSDLLSTSIQSQEKERARIAKDLHDDIGSKLNLIQMNVHLLKNPHITEEEMDDMAKQTLDLLNKTIEDTRRVSHDLLPVVLENFGLLRAVQELVASFAKNSEIKIEYREEAEEIHFSDFEKKNLFRAIQEMLKNASQHSKAKTIFLTVKSNTAGKEIHYRDDGKGYDQNPESPEGGLGLKSIMSRVEVINGKIDIQSQPGKGVRMDIIIVNSR